MMKKGRSRDGMPVRPYGARTRRGCRTNGLNADPAALHRSPATVRGFGVPGDGPRSVLA
jgi:hypothetical protein